VIFPEFAGSNTIGRSRQQRPAGRQLTVVLLEIWTAELILRFLKKPSGQSEAAQPVIAGACLSVYRCSFLLMLRIFVCKTIEVTGI